MKVILTDDVVGLGDIGETVNVKPGYARNFLVPRGLAIESETSNAKVSAHRMRQIQAKSRRLKATAEGRADTLKGKEIVLELRVGGNGRVFGSVGARDIAAKLAELGYELDRRRILLGEPIKKLGEQMVRVKLHQEVETEVKVIVAARESTKEEEEKDVESARTAIETGAAEKQGKDTEEADEDDSDASESEDEE